MFLCVPANLNTLHLFCDSWCEKKRKALQLLISPSPSLQHTHLSVGLWRAYGQGSYKSLQWQFNNLWHGLGLWFNISRAVLVLTSDDGMIWLDDWILNVAETTHNIVCDIQYLSHAHVNSVKNGLMQRGFSHFRKRVLNLWGILDSYHITDPGSVTAHKRITLTSDPERW